MSSLSMRSPRRRSSGGGVVAGLIGSTETHSSPRRNPGPAACPQRRRSGLPWGNVAEAQRQAGAKQERQARELRLAQRSARLQRYVIAALSIALLVPLIGGGVFVAQQNRLIQQEGVINNSVLA